MINKFTRGVSPAGCNSPSNLISLDSWTLTDKLFLMYNIHLFIFSLYVYAMPHQQSEDLKEFVGEFQVSNSQSLSVEPTPDTQIFLF